MSEVRGFKNIDIIDRSLRELFSRLTPRRIRQFPYTFELTGRECDRSDDPVIRVQKIARRLADHYRISVSAVVVTFRSDLYVPGRVELSPASEFFVELHTEHRDALTPTVAILAHEVAHIFLYQAGIRLEPTFHNEVLTDTTAVFLGCGAAILNAASRTTTTSGNVITGQTITTNTKKYGYLSVDEFGYVQAKRDVYFRLEPSKLVSRGLPRWGYRAGRRRLKSQQAAPPFAPASIFTRAFRALGPGNRLDPSADKKITFKCSFCSQPLRVPRLGKQLSVHCPTCQEALICHT
jgi:hypothetical protein